MTAPNPFVAASPAPKATPTGHAGLSLPWAILIGALVIAWAIEARPTSRYVALAADKRLDTVTGEVAWCVPRQAVEGVVDVPCTPVYPTR